MLTKTFRHLRPPGDKNPPTVNAFFHLFLFKVHKREVVECCDAGGVGAAPVIDVFDKFEGFFVSVDEGERIIFWIHRQEL